MGSGGPAVTEPWPKSPAGALGAVETALGCAIHHRVGRPNLYEDSPARGKAARVAHSHIFTPWRRSGFGRPSRRL